MPTFILGLYAFPHAIGKCYPALEGRVNALQELAFPHLAFLDSLDPSALALEACSLWFSEIPRWAVSIEMRKIIDTAGPGYIQPNSQGEISLCRAAISPQRCCFIMRITLFFGLIVSAFGIGACATNTTTDNTGWTWYDGTPIKGHAVLEKQFQNDDDKCNGRDRSVYKFCMSSRGYTEGGIPVAGTPVISTAAPDWRARAAEVRAVGKQLQDADAQQMMIGIAETYDRLAEGRLTARSKSPTNR